MPLTRFWLDVPALADGHMRGPNIETLLGSLGAQMDATAEQIVVGRLQAFPFAGGANPSRAGAARLADGRLIECEPFVLPIHAEQRGVRIYPTEPTLSKRVRIAQSKRIKRMRGTHRGKLLDVRPYFLTLADPLPVMRIVHQSTTGTATWHTLDADGNYSVEHVSPSNFNYDGQTSKWWRWWAFIYMYGTGIAPPNTYGDGHVYGDGERYGVKGLLGAQLADLADIFLDNIGAHSECRGVALCWGANDVDPAGTPTQDATGWWSLPNGANTWASIINTNTKLGTRPPTVQWIYDPGPG